MARILALRKSCFDSVRAMNVAYAERDKAKANEQTSLMLAKEAVASLKKVAEERDASRDDVLRLGRELSDMKLEVLRSNSKAEAACKLATQNAVEQQEISQLRQALTDLSRLCADLTRARAKKQSSWLGSLRARVLHGIARRAS